MSIAEFGDLGKRRVAALYVGGFDDMPAELENWQISDIDAFLENLEIWDHRRQEPIDALFSIPIPGIRQHLANCHDLKVGFAGEALLNNDFVDDNRARYIAKGYDVMEVRAYGIEYTPAENTSGVRIDWNNSTT